MVPSYVLLPNNSTRLAERLVAPGFLTNPGVRRWLNGVEPVWTILDLDSYNALHEEPAAGNETIRLVPGLAAADLPGSAVVRAARTLLKYTAELAGLKLTARGNLPRSVVAEMCRVIEWPDYDKEQLFLYNKVINEPDFLPLHFLRVLTQAARLIRVFRGKLILTRLGKTMLAEERYGALQAFLFHIALWRLNLSYFDQVPLESWPQNDAGVVLWSVGAAAHDWMDRETLTRLCTVPVIGVLQSTWDLGSFAMEARILSPLVWFGLLERRSTPERGPMAPQLYRKTPLFDRFLKFAVRVETPDARQ
jgi:hypothetical protein